MKRAIIVLALSPALMGASCGGPDPSVPLAPPKIERTMLRDVAPKSLLECKSEPDGQTPITTPQAARYIVDLREAGADCRRKLRAVRGLIENETE